MNCFNCGELVPEGQNFCGNCGAPQSADPGADLEKAADGERNNSRPLTWLWVLLGCGGLIVVGCCLALVLLVSISGFISDSAAEVLEQVATVEPELLDESISQIATLLPEPTLEPIETAVPTATAQHSCAGLELTTEPWIQVSIQCEEVPEQIESSFMEAPAFTRLQFIDYPVSPSFHEAQISIFPVEEYRRINEEASDRIDELQRLLRRKPAQVEQPYPFLPVWNAGQMMAAQFEYLDFDGGEGIRYITQYGQAAWPINNHDLFYSFQGLTSDGAYYISAVLPISNAELPPDGDSYIGDQYEEFIESYVEYLDTIQQQLDASASKSFNPSLSALDAVMMTLSIR